MAKSVCLACSIALIVVMSTGCADQSSPPPADVPEAASPAPSAELSGTFQFAHGAGERGFEVTLAPDGSARSTAAGPDTKTLGRWHMVNGTARIEWEDGWRNELSHSRDGWTQKTWAPGTPYSDPPVKTVPASKLP